MPNLTDELSTAKERPLNQFGTAVLVWCGKSVKFGRVCRTFVKLNLGHGTPSESDVAPVSLPSRTYSVRFGTWKVQWTCSSKHLIFREIFAGWKMSLEGKCCWAKDNSGCVRQTMSRIAGMCSLWETSFPPPPPPKGWISPLGHTHFPTKLPTENLNSALWPYPNLPVMSTDINFLVSQIAGSRCTLLAGNSSISLVGSEKQINFFPTIFQNA